MTEPRLATELRVKAAIRQGMVDGIDVMLVRRGEATAGALLVKLNRLNGAVTVLTEARDAKGERGWLAGTGREPVDEAAADAYIARHVGRDPDLWVVEVEDRQGRHPFGGRLIET
ncbi:MAG TPA: DUF1491 family protein [Stellaceae bacterium]|nr:DUF1491 family protein [Stellaceae bacterium]